MALDTIVTSKVYNNQTSKMVYWLYSLGFPISLLTPSLTAATMGVPEAIRLLNIHLTERRIKRCSTVQGREASLPKFNTELVSILDELSIAIIYGNTA